MRIVGCINHINIFLWVLMPSEIIILPTVLDALACQQIQPHVLETVAAASPIRMQASGVERIGTVGAQWLLAATLHARKSGQPLHILAPSSVLKQACKDLAIDPWLIFSEPLPEQPA